MALILPEELAKPFVGGLLTIARADGEVNPEEASELQAIISELSGPFEIDLESLMFSHVNATDLADAIIGKDRHGPFRGGANASSPAEIAGAFMKAARRIANADGEVNSQESAALRAFARALAVQG